MKDKETNFVSAVVYCHNDEHHAGAFIEDLDRVLSENFLKHEIVIVDDASTDHTMEILRKYAKETDVSCRGVAISVVHMSFYQGLENSMNAGVNLSIGDFVFEFESMQPDYSWEMLMKIYRHSLKGYDIVSARRIGKSRLMSRLYYKVFNKYAHLQYQLNSETFRVISRRAINRIHSITQTIPYRKAAYANCGLAVASMDYQPTVQLRKKYDGGSRNIAIDSLILFTDVAFRATLGLAVLMILITVGVAVYALVYRLMRNPVEGWATTIIFMSFAFSGLFAILAMVIKYLQTLVNLVFKKRDYLFESIEKLQ